ncbi:hypothetical protein HDV06_006374 [Boothiomyces sp. JEL0866]|nr:hypothetical protein HDV06_006374 [Boothiomyces sp. JEL0866]
MLSAMSSTKHQPNQRKRPISEVEPEFPSLPGLSFSAAQEFARKSQEALLSVKRLVGVDFSGKSSLFLPLLSPHQLQQRFNVMEDDSVLVVVRKPYTHLKNDVDSLNLRKYCGIYVRGPVGVGKSYLLYLLAAEYRLNRQSYRVTYINDCSMWRRRAYKYLLEELVTTFYEDTIEEKSVVEWCHAVIGSDKEDMMMMVEALINYTKQNDIQWIVICDQHNAFYARSVVAEQFPFNLIDTLADNRGTNIKIVISASANNEGYPTEMKGWNTHDISSHRFDNDEFKVWCNHYQLQNIGKVDSESEEAMDALFWTGGVPYELDLLWKQPKVTLIEKTVFYRQNRVNEMAESHSKFCRKLLDEEKLNLKECISRMALGLSPPEILIGMDRQLFNIVPSQNGNEIITALNPVARRSLLAYHGQGLMTSLGLVAELVFDGYTYTNDTKGRIIEKYITTTLELSQRFSFKSRKTTNAGLSAVNPVLRMVGIKDVIHFSGNKLPLQKAFNQRMVTLFVPKSPNYPGLDFFIWNPQEELMAFQITVKQPFSSHPKIDGANDNCKSWLDFCFDGLVQKPIKVYWIIPKSCVGQPKGFKGRVILLEELHDDFPALKKLCLDRS